MKSRFYRDRNVRLYYKYNEIRFKIIRNIFDKTTFKSSLRHKMFLMLTIRDSWTFKRVNNRDLLTSRSRGVNRLTKLSRLMLRKYASQGLLPGFYLSSW